MSAVGVFRQGFAGVLAGVLLAALSCGSSALAASPWWHLESGSRPSTLVAGSARDEVEELTVSATEGFFKLQEVEPSGNENETKITRLPYNATAAQVQEGIEREVYSGGREVKVVEGAGDTSERHSWVITLPDQAARLMNTISEELHGAERLASIREVSHGQPDGQIVVTAENTGDARLRGIVNIRDTLPAGLRAVAMEATAPNAEGGLFYPQLFACSFRSLTCSAPMSVAPYKVMEALVSVVMEPDAKSGVSNEASVSGGGLPNLSVKRPVTLGDQPGPFGVEDYEMMPEEEGGAPDTQAGSHPFQLTTTLTLNQTGAATPVALAKDLNFKLPPGLIGNPIPFPQCTLTQFLTLSFNGQGNECPAQAAVGVAVVYLVVPYVVGRLTQVQFAVPLFNLEPSVGEPARFGFFVEGTPVYLDTSVRTDGDYGVTVSADNISQQVDFVASRVTFWGVPGDPRHNNDRGWGCLFNTNAEGLTSYPCSATEVVHPSPLLSLPTSCTGPMGTSVEADSWVNEGAFGSFASYEPVPALDGCNHLPFTPSISVAPDGQAGSTPTGLTVGIHVPQGLVLNSTGLAEADVKDTTVALPVGVQISPAAADGLLSCSNQQIGFTGFQAQTALFTANAGECPDASKVGTAEIKTPLLAEPLEGSVYLAAQEANPFGSLIALYIDVQAPRAGVIVKLAGEVKLDEQTGQIVTTFPNTPQLPFEEARVHFFGGSRAPLSTPPSCGSYTSTESITPWSGNELSDASSTFQITSGPNGSPCVSPRPFQPGFEAGTTSVQAGGYSPLTLTMTRPDADQQLGKLSVVFPPGISAGLQGVRLCEEPQAASGQCPAESQIGQVIASAGLGGDPYSVETGKAYITGPYGGAPFGVDVVVPAAAGPFNLGTEVVRSKIEVDPTDAHLTVVSDRFPTMLDGIPLQLQHINVTVNRPGFVFNPTSCESMKLTGELESSEGATANVATAFQVTNCAALSFKPEFKVSTEAKTSRTEGATLHVKLTLPSGTQGTKANVHEVKVSLPKQLPSPLKTLQKACTEKVFAENPSNCPVASRVGEAKVTTPVLEGGLRGPAYFVSHGGAKYPELIIVLVGEDGVTVQVHGETFISKQGITTATFSTVPDVPFAGFELTLPKREYPALSANGNLCQAQAEGKLLMPTEMLGQNGDKIAQQTKISVTGCGKTKIKKASHKRKARKHGRRKGKK